MIVGIDFDNTLVHCAPLFFRAARERGWVPAELPPTKDKVRRYLCDAGRESDWTELQGFVYGPLLTNAHPFEGAREFVVWCRGENIPVYVVSHKTAHALKGLPHDLREAAHRWLETNGFYRSSGLSRDHVFFEVTRQDKLNRIGSLGCTHFIDDLEAVFDDPLFPSGIQKWLFAPTERNRSAKLRSFTSWEQIRDALLEERRGFSR